MKMSLGFISEIQTKLIKHSKKLQVIAILTACLFLFYFGLILYIVSFDMEKILSTFDNAAQTEFNGTLHSGKATWQLLPPVGLHISTMTFKPATKKTQFQARNITFFPSLWQLLSGNIHLKKIKVEQLTVKASTHYSHTKNVHARQANSFTPAEKSQHNQFLQFSKIKKVLVNQLNFTLNTQKYNFNLSGPQLEINGLKLKKESNFNLTGPILLKKNSHVIATGFVDFAASFTHDQQSIKVFGAQGSSTFEKLLPFDLTASLESALEYTYASDTLKIDPLNLTVNNSALSIGLTVNNLLYAPEYIVKMPRQKPQLEEFAYHFLGRKPGIDHLVELIGSIEFGGYFVATPNKTGLLLDTFKIDAHPGSINISYNHQTQEWDSEIALAYLDVRPIVQPSNAATIKNRNIVKTQQLRALDLLLPAQFLKQHSLVSQIKVGQFIHPNVELLNLSASVDLSDGILSLDPVKFHAYKGKSALRARLDLNQSPAELTLLQTAEQIDIGQLLADTTGNQWLTGSMANKLDISSQGASIRALITQAQGNLDVRMTKGRIPGANLYRLAYNSIGALKSNLGQSITSLQENKTLKSKGTSIDHFFSQFEITPSVIRSHTLLARFNNKVIDGTLLYKRKDKTMTLTTNLQLPSSIPTLNQFRWPVTCVTKEWSLPACGVSPEIVTKKLEDFMSDQLKKESTFKFSFDDDQDLQ